MAKMGAEQDAYVSVDAKGTSYAGGGVSAGCVILPGIGELMRNNAILHGQSLFPAGGKKTFAKAEIKRFFKDGLPPPARWQLSQHVVALSQ